MNGNKILNPYQYPYCQFDFLDWNPVQLKCYPFFEQDVNLIVSSSTASGKTAIAQAIMGYQLQLNENYKAVYVSPFKAIGKQKFNQWSSHKTFKNYKKSILSSEQNVSECQLKNSRIIVSTIESMNIKCRKKCSWIKNIKVFILDEAHMINDEKRGADCESLIMSITLLNPDCRIICLSGTMSNYLQIAKWIKQCNSKRTCYIHSDWRPKELKKQIKIIKNFDDQMHELLKISKNSQQEYLKTLIFVQSKKKGQKITQYLKKNGIKCVFYNSDIKSTLKNKIIFDFKNKYSDLYVLVCTSSLSTGVSL